MSAMIAHMLFRTGIQSTLTPLRSLTCYKKSEVSN